MPPSALPLLLSFLISFVPSKAWTYFGFIALISNICLPDTSSFGLLNFPHFFHSSSIFSEINWSRNILHVLSLIPFSLSPFLSPLAVYAQLVDRVFDESLNFRKIPPVISTNKAPEINGKPVELRPRAPDSLEPRALRRRTWNREEVRSNTEVHQHGGWTVTVWLSHIKPNISVYPGGVGQPAAQFSFPAVHQDPALGW